MRRRRGRKKTHHHNRPRCLGGAFDAENIYLLTEDHHKAYHTLFGLRTFQEASEVLLRMEALHHSLKRRK